MCLLPSALAIALYQGEEVAVFSLAERQVEFRGSEWFVAHNATVVGSVVVEHQASIWFNVVVRGDNDLITVGERVNVQDGAVLHTDPGIPLAIGRAACIGHKAMLHGCTIGEGSLIGINSVILNHARIGRHSIVGANTLIPEGKDYPERVLILGSPGRIVRELRPDEIEWIQGIAEGYVQRARRFRSELAPQEPPPGARGA
jgi:carbonic anhydrase/acetyltransferase-like protein (isoleucine patch superfamily)